MERTNQRVAYTLAGESGGYGFRMEVSRHDDGSQFSMNGTMTGDGKDYWCAYTVTDGNVNVSVSGPESGAAEATAALKALADAERATNGEAAE